MRLRIRILFLFFVLFQTIGILILANIVTLSELMGQKYYPMAIKYGVSGTLAGLFILILSFLPLLGVFSHYQEKPRRSDSPSDSAIFLRKFIDNEGQELKKRYQNQLFVQDFLTSLEAYAAPKQIHRKPLDKKRIASHLVKVTLIGVGIYSAYMSVRSSLPYSTVAVSGASFGLTPFIDKIGHALSPMSSVSRNTKALFGLLKK